MSTKKDVVVGLTGKWDEIMARLKAALTVKTDTDLAEVLGVQQSTLAMQKKKGNVPIELIEEICKQRHLSVDYILYGRGELLVGAKKSKVMMQALQDASKVATSAQLSEHAARGLTELWVNATGGNADSVENHFKLTSDYVMVPRYDVAASAGAGKLINDETIVDHLAFKHDWIRHNVGCDPKHLALIEVAGDSMHPTLNDRDLILLDTRTGRSMTNGVYCIQMRGSLLVKRIDLKMSGVVNVVSDNPAYPPETLTAHEMQQLTVVGRVVWHGHSL